MVEAPKSQKKMSVPVVALSIIYSFLEPRQIFKEGLWMLNKRTYQEASLLRDLAFRRIGAIADFNFDILYMKQVLQPYIDAKVLDIDFDRIERVYESKEAFINLIRSYPFKASKKLFAFGYQSTSGCETLNGQLKSDIHCKGLFAQNRINFCSGSQQNGPSIVTAALYPQVSEEEEEEELEEFFLKTRKASEAYRQLRIKQGEVEGVGAQDYLNFKFMMISGSNKPSHIAFLTGSRFVDVRNARLLLDAHKEKRLKRFKGLVHWLLAQQLLHDQPGLVEPKDKLDKFVKFDHRMHQLMSLESLFAINSFYVVNKGQFTCPTRSFFLLCHNQPIDDIKNHELVYFLQNVKDKADLDQLDMNTKNKLIPPYQERQVPGAPEETQFIEFKQSFYISKFKEFSTMEEKDVFRLRVMAFAKLGNDQERRTFVLSQNFACRYVSVLFTDQFDLEGDPQKNFDMQSIWFHGHTLPALHKVGLQQQLDSVELEELNM